MIGLLIGNVYSIAQNHLILLVGGVGYHIFASANTLRLLNTDDKGVTLYIDTHVREDHIHLYGFIEEVEKEWFSKLTQVSGVGNKVAIAILSSMNVQQLHQAILTQDKAAFKPVSGVGPKLAERIIVELKNIVGGLTLSSNPVTALTATHMVQSSILDDAVTALVGLGYQQLDALKILGPILTTNPDISLEDLIRKGLSEFVR